MSRSEAPHHVTTTFASDGTPIGYRTIGNAGGSGLVVVHGAMQSGESQRDLAEALGPEFTVHLLDRRGRGASGPYPTVASTDTEVADIQAVMAATGARAVFGVSSGALIAARVALAAATVPSAAPVDALVLFEPPLVVDHSISVDFAERVHREIEDGDVAGALVTSMLGTEMGPALLRFVPRSLLRAMTWKMLRSDDAKKLADGEVHVRQLAANLPYDLAIVRENIDRAADFAPMSADVLLLNGDTTRPYLRTAADAMAAVLPDAVRVVLPGLDHSATGNRDRRGAPDEVAAAIAAFLGSRGAHAVAAHDRRPL